MRVEEYYNNTQKILFNNNNVNILIKLNLIVKNRDISIKGGLSEELSSILLKLVCFS